MIAAEVMVPCMSFAPSCRLDWTALAAVGGWVAAAVTFLAVLLPFMQGQKDRRDQERAARFSATLSLEQFVLTLIDIRAAIRGSIQAVEADRTAKVAQSRAALLSTVAARCEYPELANTASLMDVRSDIAYLKRTLAVFSDYRLDVYSSLGDAGIAAFQTSLELCDQAVTALIKSADPYIRQDLSKVFEDVYPQKD